MKSPEELKQIFLQERIEYWKKINPNKTFTARKILNELELIQIIVGKPT
jgi:hypothetical protein